MALFTYITDVCKKAVLYLEFGCTAGSILHFQQLVDCWRNHSFLHAGFFFVPILVLVWFVFVWLCLSLLVRIKAWQHAALWKHTHTHNKSVQYLQDSCWCCIKKQMRNVICFSAGLVMKLTKTPVKVCAAVLIEMLSVKSLLYRLFRSSPILCPSTHIFCNKCLGVLWDYTVCAFSITMAARCWWGPVTIDGETRVSSRTLPSRGAPNTHSLCFHL